MEDKAEILTEEEIRAALRKVFKRSQTDWEFRRLCLSDPAEAIRLLTGKRLPEGLLLRFADGDDDAGAGTPGGL